MRVHGREHRPFDGALLPIGLLALPVVCGGASIIGGGLPVASGLAPVLRRRLTIALDASEKVANSLSVLGVEQPVRRRHLPRQG